MDTRTVNLVNPGSPGSGSPSTSPRFGTPTAAQQVLQQITPVSTIIIRILIDIEIHLVTYCISIKIFICHNCYNTSIHLKALYLFLNLNLNMLL